jgi:chromosome segregation ATPase
MSYTYELNKLDIEQISYNLKKLKLSFKNIKQRIRDEKVDRLTAIEEQTNANTESIEDLKRELEDTKTQMKDIKESVYQLLGGLYNHKTQEKILDQSIAVLFSEEVDVPNEEYNDESIWPTTRQGDKNEARIQKLEETMDVLVDETINNLVRRPKKKPLRLKRKPLRRK